MIHLMQFDMDKIDLETVDNHMKQVEKLFPEDTLVAMPMGFNWMFDVPIYILKDYITLIEEAIKIRKESDNDI